MEDHESTFITSSLSTVNNNAVIYQVINFSDIYALHPLPVDTHMADFRVFTPEQIKHIKPVDLSTLTFILHQHLENTDINLNQLMKVNQTPGEQETYWFPTPEKPQPGEPGTYTPIQQRNYDELLDLKQLEQLNSNDKGVSRKKFLDNFNWTDTTLSPFEKQHIEEILAQYHDIFARHRFDIGTNRKYKVKLTPNNDRPAYSQCLPTPINLKDDITVDLALLHRYDIITTLPFSKYASPIFAQRKPNGRLRLLVDLGKINNLITQDYGNNNHPVSTLSDAAQHMAGKKLFCNSTAPRHTIVCKWRTTNQYKCWHSISQVEPLHTDVLPKVLAVHCLPSHPLHTSVWIHGLLLKMHYLGINGNIWSLIKNFLEERTFSIRI